MLRLIVRFRENAGLVTALQHESVTDGSPGWTTGASYFRDCSTSSPEEPDSRTHMLALFDLDGFKAYNDTFGHPAGDALLVGSARPDDGVRRRARLPPGRRRVLRARARRRPCRRRASRRGAPRSPSPARASRSPPPAGRRCCPQEADAPTDALQLADGACTRRRAAGAAAAQQSRDVLLRILREREPALATPARRRRLAARSPGQLGSTPRSSTCSRARRAARRRQDRRSPTRSSTSPGRWTREWELMRTHTLIGERILPRRRRWPGGGARARQPRALGRRGLPRRARGARRSRWARGSSPSATPSRR